MKRHREERRGGGQEERELRIRKWKRSVGERSEIQKWNKRARAEGEEAHKENDSFRNEIQLHKIRILQWRFLLRSNTGKQQWSLSLKKGNNKKPRWEDCTRQKIRYHSGVLLYRRVFPASVTPLKSRVSWSDEDLSLNRPVESTCSFHVWHEDFPALKREEIFFSLRFKLSWV